MAKRNKAGKSTTAKDLVRAREQTIEAAFKSRWFELDFYQREYVWQEQQVARLISDLTRKFRDQWDEKHSLADVRSYDPYFLGPYIVHTDKDKAFLVDGQQRIITLLLLLIHLQRRLAVIPGATSKAAQLHTLIMNDRFGTTVFRVDADEYTDCFHALLNGHNPDFTHAPAAVRRIWRAYLHIETHFRENLQGDALYLFTEWLLNRVSLVMMYAGDSAVAEEMYQSINDTGLRLVPMDHLKRFLLSDADGDPRALEGPWNDMVATLEKVEQGAAFAYVRTVLRAKFPEVARLPGPSLNDATFEWIRVHEQDLWPNPKNGDRARLFTEVLQPLHQVYSELLTARSRLDPRFRAVRYNAFNGIAEQFDLTVAALRPGDQNQTWARKAAMVAGFLDLFFVTQTLSDEPVEQKHIDDLVSTVIPRVRPSESVQELGRVLGEVASEWTARLDAIADLRYSAGRKFVHYVLARLTAWVEMGASNNEADPTERFLMRRKLDRDFEIEHLFTSTASAYAHKVPDAQLYRYLRDRIGALLLLEGRENGKYGGMLLEDKLVRYRKDTLLAGMLNPDFFRRSNGTLEKFLRAKGLFELVATYEASTPLAPFIEARGQFYLAAARQVWSLTELELMTQAPDPGAAPAKRTHYGVQFQDLVKARLINAGDRLVGRRRDATVHYARVNTHANLETDDGATAASLSRAMANAVGSTRDPWGFWQLERTGDRLDVLRQRYLDHFGS